MPFKNPSKRIQIIAIGTTTISPLKTYVFGNPDAAKNLVYYNGGTYSQYFTYDGDGSLTFSKFITNAVSSPNSTSYDPGGLEYVRITYKGNDNKHTPYSAVAGYRYIAYPWACPRHFYFAMSKHNPGQILQETLDRNTMKWSLYSQSDLTYTYNEQGYPSQVKITTVDPSTATPNQAFYQTYDFTYRK